MKLPFWSYDNNSEGATALKNKLVSIGFDSFFIKKTNTGNYSPSESKNLVINWGFQRTPNFPTDGVRILNNPENIFNASNKRKCFKILKQNNIPIPDTTTSKAEAKQWASVSQGHKVYCRTTASGAYGDGIVIASRPTDVVDAELYTKGIDCKREYRTYMFNGKMIDLVAAVRVNTLPEGVTAYNDDIRNWKNGYGWARNAVTIPADIKTKLEELSKKAMEAVGLNFGAIDIVRDMDNNLFVLEINTAPGIEGITVDKFAEAIKAFANTMPAIERNIRENTRPVPASARVRANTTTRPTPIADNSSRPAGLDDDEWEIIRNRRAENARRNREGIVNSYYEAIRRTSGSGIIDHNITQDEWLSIYNRLRG